MESTLGSLEELVLLAVCGLTDTAYAVTVQQHITTAAERDVTMGAIYTTLDRLEKKGFLRSQLGHITRERGGRRKRFYEITGPGTRALARARHAREQLMRHVDPELKPSLGPA